ncbi:MAG: nitroreductase family protein [Actinobacteria bacterium]|nr:nitroreductase family protein [Actinomycetota bacterium]
MNFEDAVAARRSVRVFRDGAVPRAAVERAVALAATAPAPHHSSPWRFVVLEEPRDKERLARSMGAAWREDLLSDGLKEGAIGRILDRSHALLTHSPLAVVCCAEMSRSHSYPDERRRLAEWSLFAHTIGAALQTFMVALAAEGIASCWLSAPVFCREVVRRELGLEESIEPHALVLCGYASLDYRPRERPVADAGDYLIAPDSLCGREQEA